MKREQNRRFDYKICSPRNSRTRLLIWIIIGIVVIAAVGIIVFFVANGLKRTGSVDDHSNDHALLGKYKHAAVASDVTECSIIGKDIMEKSGGNAVDAAIASLLCMGLTDPQSMGLGGGFFMTIYNRTTGKATTINARESAPAAASKTMYYDGANSLKGGLSIAIPGEIRGYEMALKMAGTMSWADLFKPAIKMATDGFRVPKSLENALRDFVNKNGGDVKKLKRMNPEFYNTYVDPATGDFLKEGNTLKRPKLSQTLQAIADQGPDAFYNGSLTNTILEDMRMGNSNCIITEEDLLNYKPVFEPAQEVTLSDNSKVYSLNAPSSGVLLLFMMNVLDGFKMSPDDVKTKEGLTLALHRIIETFKFAYAKRTDLGDVFDPEYRENITKLVANLTSRAYADSIRAMIWDNQTHPTSYYGPTFYDGNKTSTAHLSVVDKDGNAVSVTSTVNSRFGSDIIGTKTGIVFNNEMNDFATTDKPNDYGIYPSPANEIKPGKRPLSSMCPVVFVDNKGDVKLVLGAAGGARITTSTAYVATRALWFGENIQEAINALRLHHQLLPEVVGYEKGFDQDILDGLKAKGHNVTDKVGKSIIQGIMRQGQYLYANSDYRKGGTPAGF